MTDTTILAQEGGGKKREKIEIRANPTTSTVFYRPWKFGMVLLCCTDTSP